MLARVWGRRVEGAVSAPPSKSYTHRALVCASLADGNSNILNPSLCDDTFATLKALTSLGVKSSLNHTCITVSGGELSPRSDLINCGESGTTLRFIVGVASLIRRRLIVTGEKSLLRRPVGELVRALNSLGANVVCNGDFPPVISYGGFKGGRAVVRGDVSSQFISSLLLISPVAEEESTISVSHVESKPYVMMTLKTQEIFGVKVKVTDEGDGLTFNVPTTPYKSTDFVVEGDWSSTAYFLTAAAISGYVRVFNVRPDSLQADKEILKLLKDVGASVRSGHDWVEVSEGPLESFEHDVSDSPDLLPTLAVLAASAKGESIIRGIGRCRLKESDRVEAVYANLRGLGVAVDLRNDELIIKGGEKIRSGTIKSYGDHRIAMAFSLLSLKSEGDLLIDDPMCVSKSFPNFWGELTSLGVKVEVLL